LRETRRHQKATLQYFLTLQRQIEKRRQLIQTLHQEIAYAEESIQRTRQVVEALNEDLERLQHDYGEMLRSAYRQHLTHSNLLFLFSAATFNEAYRRWQYLRRIEAYRRKQAELILETRKELSDKVTWLEQRKADKLNLLASEERQTRLIELELREQDRLLASLKNNEARLSTELRAKQKAAQDLENAIERIIRREMDESPANDRDAFAEAASSRDFADMKGRLPWPVEKGIITAFFGKQVHPTIKSVEIQNNGIDIGTPPDSPVKAVFGGKVVGTRFIPGFQYMVMLKHGSYYTVYSNLRETYVQKGQRVEAGHLLGRVSTNPQNGEAELHFEIWHNKERRNPVDWLKGR
ncbi:MAG: hypothetical protein D6765_04805, partial [Bacteroidetes bacterium]